MQKHVNTLGDSRKVAQTKKHKYLYTKYTNPREKTQIGGSLVGTTTTVHKSKKESKLHRFFRTTRSFRKTVKTDRRIIDRSS